MTDNPWIPGKSYKPGDKVVAGSMLFVCMRAHRAHESNNPLTGNFSRMVWDWYKKDPWIEGHKC